MVAVFGASALGSVWASPTTANPNPNPDGIPFASPHAAAVRVPSAPDAWGGPRSGSEATLSDRVVDYRIHATLDPVKHTITGKQQLTWRNRSDRSVSTVYLHLYLNAFESSGSTFNTEKRERSFGFRSGVDVEKGDWGYTKLQRVVQNGLPVKWRFVQPDGGPTTDHTVVRLDLPTPVAPGARTTLAIDFFDQLPRVSARTGYFSSFHLVAQWFPKIGVLELPGERGATAPRWNVHEFHLHSEFYADFGNYDVTLTVPKGYTVGATGELQGAPVELTPGKAGGMVSHRYVQGDVHDFAWTADKRYAKPLLGTYRGAGSPQVTVRVLYHPEYASNAQPVLQATLDSLKYFSETLGPYPYRTVTVVIPPHNAGEAGGMEYPTFFTASSYENVEPGTLQRYLLDFVTIHEFGHGYFYGILGSNEFEEPMLDEGLNEYWDMRMIRERDQRIHLSTPWMRWFGINPSMRGFESERLGAMLAEPADPLGQNSWDRYSSGSYGSVYSRTATVMRDLEARLGKDVTERAFKAYYARWKFRHPSIADLQQVLAEVSGKPEVVAGVFAQQVYGVHPVDDRIVSLSSDEVLPQPGLVMHKGKRVELTNAALDKAIEAKREQWKKAHPAKTKGRAKDGAGPFPYRTHISLRRKGAAVPQAIRVIFADGSNKTVRWDDQRRWVRLDFTTRSKAVSAELDPLRRVYLDADKLDDSRTLKANGAAARRWSSDFVALLQTLYALLVTL